MPSQFVVGQTVGVLCAVTPGPFSDEPIVTFDTVDVPISGFIDEDELRTEADGRTYVRCIIKEITPSEVTVWIRGAFFTTNGLASMLPKELAAA